MAYREPVVQTEPIGSSVPLQTDGPLTEAQLAGKTHIVETRILRFAADADGNAAGTYELWTIPPGVQILSVDAVILAAFTATATLQIQDGSANWIVAGELAEQTPGSVQRSVISASGTGTNGVYYTATDTLDLVIGVATCIIGEIGIVVKFIDWTKFIAADIA